MNYLFPRFLESDSEYDKAEDYWSRLFRDSLGNTQHWKMPWLQTRFVDQTRFAQGDPIYSAANQAETRAVRVDMRSPEPNQPDFEAWLGTFGEPDDVYVKVLRISCALSSNSAAIAHKLISAWLVEEVSEAMIKRLIRDATGQT